MKLFEQAKTLTQAPVTLENLQEYDALLSIAKGEEAEQIGALYTALISNAAQDVYEQYLMQSFGQA